jgi:hypothetical protein
MLKFLKFIGYSLERSERNYPRIFWFCSLLIALLFNLRQSQIVDEVQFQRTQALTISGGGNQNEPNYFVPPKPEVPPNNPNNSANTRFNNYYPKSRYPWGIDPSYNHGGGGGGELPDNQIPENDKWVSDQSVWDKAQHNDSSTSEEEENIKQSGKLKVHVDFKYEYDSNGNPTLLVPNLGKARTKRNYHRVEFDQTVSHMHHAPDLNIPLPSDFDMVHYMNLNRADRIDYAKQKLF